MEKSNYFDVLKNYFFKLVNLNFEVKKFVVERFFVYKHYLRSLWWCSTDFKWSWKSKAETSWCFKVLKKFLFGRICATGLFLINFTTFLIFWAKIWWFLDSFEVFLTLLSPKERLLFVVDHGCLCLHGGREAVVGSIDRSNSFLYVINI